MTNPNIARHMPGPWDVAIHEVDGARSIRIISPTGGVVALCKAASGHKEANARLIAAAPELLALLKECERVSADTARQLGNTAAQPLLNKIRVAIAKAEGREFGVSWREKAEAETYPRGYETEERGEP